MNSHSLPRKTADSRTLFCWFKSELN